jgi:predicted nucleic acid-binding protein
VNVVIDSNIIVRTIHHQSPHHSEAKAAIETLTKRNETLYIFPQMLYEFWTVATRPLKNNGLGLCVVESYNELTRIKSLFRLLPDSPAILPEWERMIVKYAVSGKNNHDARIAAAMNVYGITHLITFNKNHFARFTDIIALLPSEV